MPMSFILNLINKSIEKNFAPIIYLHNYDFDSDAKKIRFDFINKSLGIPNDYLRRIGRNKVVYKLQEIQKYYDFMPLNSLF